MEKTFAGRAAIVASIPELIAAQAANYKARIVFTLEGFGTFESPFRIIGTDRVDFCINYETKKVFEALGSRTLVGNEWNNLTPHTLSTITVKA